MCSSHLKKAKRTKPARRDLPIDQGSGAGRFYAKLVRDVEADLGGRRHLSRIESELIRGFAGCATLLQYMNVQVALGEISEIDLGGYATLASTMLRIGSRLGLRRVPRDVTPNLDQYLALKAREQEEPDGADRSLEDDEQ
jgi:hypothetical protein